ncbi:MAG: hypothetical protein KME55_29575 [Nostoc indistinguendum CM1-VF10]|jgi:hypothetical protein|nr:hypothetical protein [Nostoc indistinguendum CM1-VF10]
MRLPWLLSVAEVLILTGATETSPALHRISNPIGKLYLLAMKYKKSKFTALLNQNMNHAITSSLRVLGVRSVTEPYLR